MQLGRGVFIAESVPAALDGSRLSTASSGMPFAVVQEPLARPFYLREHGPEVMNLRRRDRAGDDGT